MNDTAIALRERLIRNINEVPLTRQHREPLYDSVCGSVSQGTAARQLGASFDVLAPGKCSCPYHFHHAEEEMFIVIEGEGSLRVAGELLAIRAGDVLFIPAGPEYPHQIVNTSGAPLKYLSISTQSKVEICEYPDAGKLGVFGEGLRHFQRRGDGLDYWHGEP